MKKKKKNGITASCGESESIVCNDRPQFDQSMHSRDADAQSATRASTPRKIRDRKKTKKKKSGPCFCARFSRFPAPLSRS